MIKKTSFILVILVLFTMISGVCFATDEPAAEPTTQDNDCLDIDGNNNGSNNGDTTEDNDTTTINTDIDTDVTTDDDCIDVDGDITVDTDITEDNDGVDLDVSVTDTNVTVGDGNTTVDSTTSTTTTTGDNSTVNTNNSTTQVVGDNNTVETTQKINYVYNSTYNKTKWYYKTIVKENEVPVYIYVDGGETGNDGNSGNNGQDSNDGTDGADGTIDNTGNTGNSSNGGNVGLLNQGAQKEEVESIFLSAKIPENVTSNTYALPKTGMEDPSWWVAMGVIIVLVGGLCFVWRNRIMQAVKSNK